MQAEEKFELLFKFSSYGVAFCGLFALFASGGISFLVTIIFATLFVLAWRLEKSTWQISERLALFLIAVLLPIFFVDWKYQLGFLSRETATASSLGKLILTFTVIKLLQKKADRDWFFIYLISFFEVLLAAGLSISPLFIVSLVLYLLFTVCAIICFEIKRNLNGSAFSHEAKFTNKFASKLFAVSVAVLLLIILPSIPIFFLIPRVGSAGIGSGLGSGLTTGFSDSIRLGQIAKVQQSNEVVMRVRIEGNHQLQDIKWRGTALDFFDNLGWYKTRKSYNESFLKTEQDFFVVNGASQAADLVEQTIYLEPLDTPILFGLWRPVAIQGAFKLINKDAEDAISVARSGTERFSYKVYSDVSLPRVERLRADNVPYPFTHYRYLQLPERIDPRIARLAEEIITKARATNRYDKAKAIETYLQENFGYTLDLKAGGSDPVSDFLFNVREGHCEYFATAMAIMLRTQGIATRVVTGFQSGDYNETAGMYIVRQRNAHAWVEVYFPTENAWVAFDPTPAAGRSLTSASRVGIVSRFGSYLEALETLWIQYIVTYDSQEQKSFVGNLQANIKSAQTKIASWLKTVGAYLAEWWKDVSGQRGIKTSLLAILKALLLIVSLFATAWLLRWIYAKLKIADFWLRIKNRLFSKADQSAVEFYGRMIQMLKAQGFERESSQTPLEFATSVGIPEVMKITEKYNEVRFGGRALSETDKRWIAKWFAELENKLKGK